MKRLLALATLLIVGTFSLPDNLNYHFLAAKCVGAKNCRACKNCKYCKHCNEDGGTCGVCR
jgi:hypothetical protein